MDYAAVGQAISRFSKRLDSEVRLRGELREIQQELSKVEGVTQRPNSPRWIFRPRKFMDTSNVKRIFMRGLDYDLPGRFQVSH
jgi:hypothetical protein